MFFQSVSAEVDGVTLDKDSSGRLRIKDGGVSQIKLAADTSKLVASETIASAVQNVDFSSLDINTHGAYRMVISLHNGAAAQRSYLLYANADHVDANYDAQKINGLGVNAAGQHTDAPYIGFCPANIGGQFIIDIIRDGEGNFRYGVSSTNHVAANFESMYWQGMSVGTIANITDLRLHADGADGIGVGTKIYLFKVLV